MSFPPPFLFQGMNADDLPPLDAEAPPPPETPPLLRTIGFRGDPESSEINIYLEYGLRFPSDYAILNIFPRVEDRFLVHPEGFMPIYAIRVFELARRYDQLTNPIQPLGIRYGNLVNPVNQVVRHRRRPSPSRSRSHSRRFSGVSRYGKSRYSGLSR